MAISDRVSARILREIDQRAALINEAGPGASLQFIVQTDAAGLVKSVKLSIQVASHGVISE